MRRILRLRFLIPALVLILVLARIGLHYGAEVTIKGAFYDALGMGDVYSTRWHWSVALAAIGVGIAFVLSLPVLIVGHQGKWFFQRRPRPAPAPNAGPSRSPDDPAGDPSDPRGDPPRRLRPLTRGQQLVAQRLDRTGLRLVTRLTWLITFAVLAGVLAAGMEGSRDELLAWFNAASFGVTDPIFGEDVGFFAFSEPALSSLASLAASAFGVATAATVGLGMGIWFVERQRDRWREATNALRRTQTLGFLFGGLFVLSTAAIMWLSRYRLTTGGDEVVAGAGAAVRDIDIPTRTVGAIALAVLAVALIAMAVPALRARVAVLDPARATFVGLVIWAVIVVTLVIFADPWWLALAVPLGVAAFFARRRKARIRALRLAAPLWAWPAFVALTAIVLSVIGPLGAALNDGLVLRGSQLQVERANIEATLTATRRATGIDQADTMRVAYTRTGVTREAIAAAPASVGSLRFLDIPPTQEACSRLQNGSVRFYACQDVDIDRYPVRERVDADDPPTVVFTDGRDAPDNQRRTVFSVGREIDYAQVEDFQRRHFTYTHGYGLIMAPVNRIDPATGRPDWIAGYLPQRGLQPTLARPEIYFGAQPEMPFAVVNTDQPEFDRTADRRIDWQGGTGIGVGSGWRRLALVEFLGGLPYIGGGRRLWNATSGRPADANSQVLLYRDIGARVREMAPFLVMDSDPFFVAADDRLYVMAAAYVASDRYPYGASFGGGGVNYARQAVTITMDAYSGETRFYVMDPEEPILKTWMRVYPDLFTPLGSMPAPLRQHLRYGEDLFDFQAAALARFHVTDTDVFFNGDQAWAFTEELYGPGERGEPTISPARYTYAVLPGETEERFLAIRSYKPAARRGIGFSGWLAASNEPDDFGTLTVLEFPADDTALESIDTFTSNVGRDSTLGREINFRANQVQRGNTIVVPIGEGLLYVQPLYLDSGDPLPSLWQVVVSFGDGRVYYAPQFDDALELALTGRASPTPPSTPPPPGTPPPPPTTGDPPEGATVQELVAAADTAFRAYEQATAAGDPETAGRELARVRRLLQRAAQAAGLTPQPPPGTAPTPPPTPPATTPTP